MPLEREIQVDKVGAFQLHDMDKVGALQLHDINICVELLTLLSVKTKCFVLFFTFLFLSSFILVI